MEETKKTDEIKTFVNAEDVLDKLRENNMNTVDSVCELVDNSLDANARNIWIDFGLREGKNSMWMLIQDDGHGVQKDEIMRALRLGGTMNPSHSKLIGRFGMGLSNACASQTPKTVFASKTKEDKKVWANEIDFDYLKTHKAHFPETYELKEPFMLKNMKFKDSGTMVYWTICDNLDKAKPATLHAHLLETISRIYRYFMNYGRKIYLNGIEVQLFDPLCRLENHRFKDEYGIQELYGSPIIIPVKYTDEKGMEKTSDVVVSLVLLDYMRLIGDSELRKKLEVGMRKQGLYLIRNDREVGNPEWFGTATQRYDWLNYVRGEIRFSSEVDHEFGIGHNKSRAVPKDVVLDALKTKVAPRIGNCLIEHKRRVHEYEDMQKAGGSELARNIHENAKHAVMPEPQMEKPKGPTKTVPKTVEQVKAEMAKKIDNTPTMSPLAKKARKELLDKLLDGKYGDGLIPLPDGATAPIFRVEVAGGKRVVILNADHKFYEYVYEPATESGYRHTILDLVFYVLADIRDEIGGEFHPYFDDIVERFSKRYAAMFNQKDFAEALAELDSDSRNAPASVA